MSLLVAAARYPIDRVASFAAWADKQRAWIADAAARGAQLVVLPEYLGCELGGLLDDAALADPVAMLHALQPLFEPYVATYRALAVEHRVAIQAGTFLVAHDGKIRNRAVYVDARGAVLTQDKLALTGYEGSLGALEPGDAPLVFALDDATTRAGIAICYDVEFPLPVRAQVDAGARLVLVPSCTDTEAGATRVRVGCQARALENQVYVAQSVTAGAAPWNPVLDANTGEAAIYAPIDRGFPPDGYVARSGEGRWAIATLDFDALDAVRADGQVANDRDWAAQLRPNARIAKLATPQP